MKWTTLFESTTPFFQNSLLIRCWPTGLQNRWWPLMSSEEYFLGYKRHLNSGLIHLFSLLAWNYVSMALFEQRVQYLDRNNTRLAFVCACSRVVHTMVTNSFPFILAIRHECFNKVDFRLGNNNTKANG